MSKPTLFLVDGSSQMYRAYHAIRGLTGPDGRSTNAVYGFTTMLRKLINEQKPAFIAAAFDLPHRAAIVLLDMSALLEVDPSVTVTVTVAAPVPQFPAVSYDHTESVRHTQAVGDVLKRLRGSHEYLESVFVKDLYAQGKDTYNLTLAFTYRAKDRTLTEDEAKKVHEKVLAQMGA